jgi:hypothetical protein
VISECPPIEWARGRIEIKGTEAAKTFGFDMLLAIAHSYSTGVRLFIHGA